VSGVANWHCTFSEQPYIQHLAEQKEQLVYLTADSSEVMQEVDPNKIYIIGGRLARELRQRCCVCCPGQLPLAAAGGLERARRRPRLGSCSATSWLWG
jgi:hypothetical protein